MGGFTRDTQWLVWIYESDCTLGDALDGVIGQFPGDVEEIMVGTSMRNANVGKRDVAIIRKIFKQVRTFPETISVFISADTLVESSRTCLI